MNYLELNIKKYYKIKLIQLTKSQNQITKNKSKSKRKANV